VDWIGLDVFNTGPDLDWGWGTPSWRSFGQVLSEPYEAVTALWRKPLILAEVGCTEAGGSKAAWITNALTVELQARFPRVGALVWFDVDKEHEQPWLLHSSPSAVQAWIDAASLPFFAAGDGRFRI
jgi:hypothetical protein